MGYLNRILDADLSTGKNSQFGLDDELKKNFLGGKGIAAKLLYDRSFNGYDGTFFWKILLRF